MPGDKVFISNDTKSQFRQGSVKFLRDAWSILEMKFLFMSQGWILYLIRPLVFPLAIFLWLRIMAPEEPEVALRMVTGAIIFGFALSTANMLAQQIILDRFSGRLKLIITMPISKFSYGLGVLAFAMFLTAPMVVLLLMFAAFAGVDFQLTWVFFPLLLPVLLTMGGLTFIVASYAPSQEAGSIMANLVGIVLVVVSPVFFSMDRAPLVLKILGWVSPMRYAADGIMKSLSGRTDVWIESVILISFAGLSMTVGLWNLRWREP